MYGHLITLASPIQNRRIMWKVKYWYSMTIIFSGHPPNQQSSDNYRCLESCKVGLPQALVVWNKIITKLWKSINYCQNQQNVLVFLMCFNVLSFNILWGMLRGKYRYINNHHVIVLRKFKILNASINDSLLNEVFYPNQGETFVCFL